jgi:hypothetical protein
MRLYQATRPKTWKADNDDDDDDDDIVILSVLPPF